MMKDMISTVVLLLTFLPGTQTYSGPNCLGPFCVDRSIAVRKLFQRLGPPPRKTAPYCYGSQDGRAFLYIQTIHSEPGTAAEVFLSSFPNCLHIPKRLTGDDLYAWKTPAGIGLGSSESDVIKAYGKPTDEWKIDLTNARTLSSLIHGYRPGDRVPKVGDRAISYKGDLSKDLRVAEFGIRSGKVSWIWLSVNE